MKSRWLGVLTVLVLAWAFALAAEVQVAEASKRDLRRSSYEGPVSIDLTYLSPTEGQADGALTFEVRINTHSVDLDQYDLAKLSRLEVDGGASVEPLGWFNPGGGGHHRYGQLRFPASRPDGSPLVGSGARYIEVVIQGVGGVAERRFRWELPITR